MSEHVSRETLQLLADGQLDREAVKSVRRHLEKCAGCAASYGSMTKFNDFMRRMPSPVLEREFADKVLLSLGIPPRPSLTFRFLAHAASIVGFFMVVLMGGTIWALLTFAHDGEVTGQKLPGAREVETVGNWVTSAYASAGVWISRALSTMQISQGARVLFVLLLMATLVAAGERLAGRKRTTSGL
jgi:anti-sigma factor RsiW